MAINGYYIKRNFFSGEPQENPVTFYLTDGSKDTGNVANIKNIGVSFDIDNKICRIAVIGAFSSIFNAELNLSDKNDLRQIEKFVEETKEWFGLTQQWREISPKGKSLTVAYIEDGKTTIRCINFDEEVN